MTYQEFFNQAWQQASSEPLGWSVEERRCLYRVGRKADAEGRCLIGGFIPDEKYKLEMEEAGIFDLLERFPGLKPHFPKDQGALGTLMWRVQRAHDDAFQFVDDAIFSYPQDKNEIRKIIRIKLRKVAKDYNFTIPE